MLARRLRPPHPIDVATTLAPLAHGRADPCVRIARDSVWRAANTPEGPGTQHIEARGDEIEVRAWGPGARWLLETAPDLVGCCDDDRGFNPATPVLLHARARLAGLRIGASRSVMEILVPTILEQKVAGAVARRSYSLLVQRHGTSATGPRQDLRVPPEADVLSRLPYWSWHPLGVERRRAETIRLAATRAGRLEEADCAEELHRRLMSLRGVGAWTTAIVARTAAGDADAVEVGDYHVPHTVTWALAGEERGDDERMLELLEPYRGHRGRVIRLIEAAGIRAPRRGPRMRLRPIGA